MRCYSFFQVRIFLGKWPLEKYRKMLYLYRSSLVSLFVAYTVQMRSILWMLNQCQFIIIPFTAITTFFFFLKREGKAGGEESNFPYFLPSGGYFYSFPHVQNCYPYSTLRVHYTMCVNKVQGAYLHTHVPMVLTPPKCYQFITSNRWQQIFLQLVFAMGTFNLLNQPILLNFQDNCYIFELIVFLGPVYFLSNTVLACTHP